MTAKVWLRLSAVLTLIFCLAHTFGYPWVGGLSADQLTQMSGINTITVVTEGFERSYSDFHKGFGLYISAMLLVQAIVMWQLGSTAKTEPRTAKFVTAALACLFAGTVVLDYFFFFWGPIVFSALIALTLAIAFYVLGHPAKAAR